ncbi:hypothetical protein L9F63_013356, partial [Diploptera punctata]
EFHVIKINMCSDILGFLVWISFMLNSMTAGDMVDTELKTPQLIRKYGYPAESHQVMTEDGYILTMHRIPDSPNSPAGTNKSVVFLQHGILATSSDWIVLGPNNSLAYILADEGYDVWMGNSRGNTYSRKHKTMSSSNDLFWNFSFHEFGVYDLAAEIDYVLNVTNQDALYFAADSLGNTDFFVLVCQRPEYNSKIKVMAAEAPFMLAQLLNFLGFRVLAPFERPMITLAQTLCSNSLTKFICEFLIQSFSGAFDNLFLSTIFCEYIYCFSHLDYLPTIISHFSGGISIKVLMHIIQNMKAGKFQSYDYGRNNPQKYNQIGLSPPEYNLSAITLPVALYYGENDRLVIPQEVYKLNGSLGNSILMHRIPRKTFSHFGFLYGIHVKPYVNDRIIELFK